MCNVVHALNHRISKSVLCQSTTFDKKNYMSPSLSFDEVVGCSETPSSSATDIGATLVVVFFGLRLLSIMAALTSPESMNFVLKLKFKSVKSASIVVDSDCRFG